MYDVVFDVVGASPFSRTVRSLAPGGRFLIANPSFSSLIRGPWASLTGKHKVISGTSIRRSEDLDFVVELIESGAIRPVVDRCYPLERTAEAHRYVESGRKKGNVVITVGPAATAGGHQSATEPSDLWT
jgi:NADPH:quinone reductase-like Zn-dependent oxidoreductase